MRLLLLLSPQNYDSINSFLCDSCLFILIEENEVGILWSFCTIIPYMYPKHRNLNLELCPQFILYIKWKFVQYLCYWGTKHKTHMLNSLSFLSCLFMTGKHNFFFQFLKPSNELQIWPNSELINVCIITQSFQIHFLNSIIISIPPGVSKFWKEENWGNSYIFNLCFSKLWLLIQFKGIAGRRLSIQVLYSEDLSSISGFLLQLLCCFYKVEQYQLC